MRGLLSSSEIITAIDRAGNRDGVATSEDIRPHLDAGQKMSLDDSDGFRLALQSLNRFCGQPRNIFHLPSLLRCSAIQNGKIDPTALEKQKDHFVQTQLDRLFNNPQSDDLIRQRYRELADFIKNNQIPTLELLQVLENHFRAGPLEELFLERAPASLQKDLLFQVSLYAGLWHLKNNVRAFAPEALAKYPEWFRKKVAGFEDNILGRLREWKITPKIGDKHAFQIFYDDASKEITTPDFAPLPSLLQNALPLMWHESFHAWRSQRVDAEPIWIAERDATLVAAIGLFKMKGITHADDKRLEEFIREMATEKNYFQDFLATHLYALAFYQQRKEEMARLEPAMVEAFGRHIMADTIYPSVLLPADWGDTYKKRRASILTMKKETEEQIRSIEKKMYPWPQKNSAGQPISFQEMINRLNTLAQNYSEGLTKEEFSKIDIYLGDVYTYTTLLSTSDFYNVLLRNLDSRTPMKKWPPISRFRDLPLSFQFQQKYRWVFIFDYLRFR